MVDMTQLQAIYGGTFDPVHYGHLKPVEILANQIGLSKVIIMPNNVPPHRPQPEATSAQRMHMLKLAIADKPLFTLDERELRRFGSLGNAGAGQGFEKEDVCGTLASNRRRDRERGALTARTVRSVCGRTDNVQ
mgnify:CR=1 FL=1